MSLSTPGGGVDTNVGDREEIGMDSAPAQDETIEQFLEGMERRLLAQLENKFLDHEDIELIEAKLRIVKSVR